MSFMAADPFTLLLSIVLMLAAAGIVWWTLATASRLAPAASLCLAVANALLAGSLASHALRGVALPLLAYWGSDVFALAALAVLRAGVPAIAGEKPAWRGALLIAAPAAAVLALMPYDGDLRWQARVVYLALGLQVLFSIGDAWRHLRGQLNLKVSLLLVSPLAGLLLMLLARWVEAWIVPAEVTDIREATRSNIVFLWSTLLMCLTLNATMACLILTRLILRIQRLTQRDPLTDVLNRRALHEAIEAEHARLQRGKAYALVMIDMDRFKQLNDTLGHAAGDAALQRLVQVLTACVREVDRIGRLGGEEFCVLLPLTDLVGATLVAERMRQNLEESAFDWQGQAWSLTASFGIAEAQSGDASAEAVLMRADQAMYRAKAQGRNVVQVDDV